MAEAVETRQHVKLVREGNLAADVEVALLRPDEPDGWGSYLSPQDARKLDAVRQALRAGDITTAQQLALRVYTLTPATAE